MTAPSSRARAFQLALVASAAIGLGACSKTNSTDVPPPNATASTPAPVAMAPAPAPTPAPAVAPAPAPAPVVVAQNDSANRSAYEAGRRDQIRQDARRAEQQRVARERAEERPLPPRADRDSDVRREQRVAAATCTDCGVVESVQEVKVQGQTNGVGALAGGATGALLGNRVAGSNNRTLGGVVGAVGGGLIGNAIEKHHRAGIAYDVNVRMQDGTLRTVREATAPVVGEKVRVGADGLHQRS